MLFIPSSSHEEIVKQTLQNLMHYKSRNIIKFRSVLLKLEKHQNILPLLWPSLTHVKEQPCFVRFLPSVIAPWVLSKRLEGLRMRSIKEVSRSNRIRYVETENGKPGTGNLNKWPLRALIRRINHCCLSIIPSHTDSGLRPWHYFTSVSAEVRRSEGSMPKKPWKESFLAIFYEEFPAKITVSRAFLEPFSLISKSSLNLIGGLHNRPPNRPLPLVATLGTLRLPYQSQIPNWMKTVTITIFWLTP